MAPSVPGKSWLITGVGLVGKALNKVIYNYPISDTMSTRYKFIDNNAVYFHHLNSSGMDGYFYKRNV